MKIKFIFPTLFLLIMLQNFGFAQTSLTYDVKSVVTSSPTPTPTPKKILTARNKKTKEKPEKSSAKDILSKDKNLAEDTLTEKAEPAKKVKTAENSPTEIEFNHTEEHLTNGFGAWRSSSINFLHKFNQRQVVYGSYNRVERFKKDDDQVLVGFYQPLTEKWTLLLEGDISPTHRVLRKWSLLTQAEYNFRKGWIAKTGYRRSGYNSANANIGNVGVEKYWGQNRAAYTLYINNLEKVGTSPSHRLEYNRYYGNQVSNIGVSFSFGRELESLGSLGTLQTNVENLTISGRHWVKKRWAVNYGLTFHKQGKLYTRRGLNLGIRYRF